MFRCRLTRMLRIAFHRWMSLLCPAVMLVISLQATNAMAGGETYKKVLPSTVWIITANGEDQTSTGTGVFIDADKKLVLTNAHVVGDSRTAVVFFPEKKNGETMVKRKQYLDSVLKLAQPGRIVAVDRKRDLALIELAEVPERAEAIAMAETSVTTGESVDLIGNPGGSDVLWVYTSGTVRSIYQKKFKSDHGEHDFRVVETQTPIKPGDSGGPVVNQAGELIAIAQSFSPSQNLVSYCVDVQEINAFVKSPWKAAPLGTKVVLKNAEVDFELHSTGHYEVKQKLASGTTQSVFVAKDTEYFQRADVRKVWSLVSVSSDEPSAELMMRLMRQNSATKIGGWVVEKNGAGEFLILYVAKLDATAPDEAVAASIDYVARIAGAMSKQLKSKTPEETKTESSTQTLASWLAK
ncbi:S1 family peptidase [Rhodopirellula europaea]|uniref:Serine protease n=1 Tax=Rhodopirellula europaea 6C TaxID=1263867 RepID=M2A9L2_9BACT|nr:serine protease [Rhodopirellula europaea]EMB18901.1 serine protease [Rhodopirellula europaea 6C]